MKCAWQAYISLLPHRMRQEVDRQGKERLQELRLRVGHAPQLIFSHGAYKLSETVLNEDIGFVINAASEYSPWAAQTVKEGFLTAQGGHRIGICGISSTGRCGISHPTSVCIRVARDFDGISRSFADIKGSILMIGPPGSGKTTLLRDLIRMKSDSGQGSVAVIDEREELFPHYKGQPCFYAGECTDIMSGCSKAAGIVAVLRSMNPHWIAVDEITAQEDCTALLHAGWCGVNLLATAHAGSMDDLRTRPVYRELIRYRLFSTVVILQRDKSFTVERIQS